MTQFAVINMDNTCELVKRGKDKFAFVSWEIPHKGLRYKTYNGALAMAERINRSYTFPHAKVAETYL